MARMNPSDTQVALIVEATAGSVPTTPAWITLPVIPGSMPQLTSDSITSQTLQANRASLGIRKVNYRVEGGLKVHFRRHDAIEVLLASALSGSWSSNVLKASNVDSNISIEKKLKDSAGAFFYQRYSGCQGTSFKLDVEATGVAEAMFDVLGMSRTSATTIVTGATYPAATISGTPLAGIDVGTLTIAGVTGVFRSLSIEVNHNREPQDQFGNASALGVGTSGFRSAKFTCQLYRNDLVQDATMASSDAPVAVNVTIGSGTGNTLAFLLPAVVFEVPQDAEDNSKQLITISGVCQYDSTTGTDMQITRS